METLQQIYEGWPDSQLQGCSVKSVRCRTCRATIGVRCVDAPEGKAHFRYVTYFVYLVPLHTSIRHTPIMYTAYISLPDSPGVSSDVDTLVGGSSIVAIPLRIRMAACSRG